MHNQKLSTNTTTPPPTKKNNKIISNWKITRGQNQIKMKWNSMCDKKLLVKMNEAKNKSKWIFLALKIGYKWPKL